MKRIYISLSLALSILAFTLISGCGEKTSLVLESDDFDNDTAIPMMFTCDGVDISPSLTWMNSPEETKSFALICDDPDAPGGTFVHWIIFNIPADSQGLIEDVPHQEQLEDGILQGKNSFGDIGYGGPCPPSGKPHHYRFTLYALDCIIDAPPGLTRSQLINAMRGHILETTELVGLYNRL